MTVGKNCPNFDLNLLGGLYKLQLKVFAVSAGVGKKKAKIRGPECVPDDFDQPNKFVNDDNLFYYKKIEKNKVIVKDTTRSNRDFYQIPKAVDN